MKYSVLIAEDNSHDREIITSLVRERNDLRVAGVASNGGEAHEFLACESVDIVFLDIDMPVCSGFDVLDGTCMEPRPYVIVTTAHPDFAPEAFNLEIPDFIVKPVTPERFARAVDRFLKRAETGSMDQRLSLTVKGHRLLFPLAEILYLSSHGRKTVIHCRGEDSVMPILMKDISEMLPGEFVRVHRQYIVNRRCIMSMDCDREGRRFIRLKDDDDTRIPVGRSMVKTVAGCL